jgi:hypothetical protein
LQPVHLKTRAGWREKKLGERSPSSKLILSVYDPRRKRGEQVRVRRILFGRAPATFRVYRGAEPSSASCDLELSRGERRILILYSAPQSMFSGPQFRIHGLCSDFLVQNRPHLAVTLQEARRRGR